MKNMLKLVAMACTLGVVSTPLAAQEDSLSDVAVPQNAVKLAGDVKAVKTVTDDTGAERTALVEPDLIVPGDRLIFGTDYANTSSETVTDFVVTNPLPSAVRLAPDADPELVVSVDGAKTWGTVSALSVTEEDGSSRPASHADVTHVRWTLATIAPGESGRLEYPAIIR
ncbi:hypothetical protein [Erythrobacter sp. THAF29]|uniref:hypothetical protein n=1 Tax=Erythrobacter sp. THAF29 TaxID=2587851 RepID=UPI0012685831|nr:hypothetical protein [Erythrobacter sp. THAF29]QFT77595.1 hypothetical protein FIU90_08595 [Erythrobacter sp. THAF29]